MLTLTRKTDFALLALARLAEGGYDGGVTLSTRQIAEEFSLPLPHLMNIFKCLQRAGFVRSTRGAHGGYELAHRPEQIKVVSVIEAIEGPVRLASCCEEEQQDPSDLSCTAVSRCPITGSMRKIHERIIEYLSNITIEDLITSEVDVLLSDVGTSAARSLEPELPVKGS